MRNGNARFALVWNKRKAGIEVVCKGSLNKVRTHKHRLIERGAVRYELEVVAV